MYFCNPSFISNLLTGATLNTINAKKFMESCFGKMLIHLLFLGNFENYFEIS